MRLVKTILLLSLNITLLLSQTSWQTVTVSDTVVNLRKVEAYTQHSSVLTLQNNAADTVHILAAQFEEDVFWSDLQGTEKIPPGGQQSFNIYFKSDQNVNYTDFLRIELDAGIHPIVIETSAQTYYTDSYYDATQNLWGSQLKQALHNTIKGHTQYSYSDLWNILSDTDEDPSNPNNVILLYTGWSYPKNNHGGNADQWNREHVWAKSHGDFGNNPPAGTDAHHIRPTDVTVNSQRGNLDFDNGGTEYIDGDGATGCYYDNDSWEPRDAVKGDVARMMYYMVVRYEGEEGYDLELVDYTPSTTSNEPLFGKKSTLYQWHWADSVDSWERRRNERIYTNWQHNRNPFIDHPEFADRLPSISGLPIPSGPELAVAPQSVDMDTIGLNDTADYYLAIINTGVADLNVSNIVSTNSQFTVGQSSMVLAPENYGYLRITFASQATVGTFTTTIQLTTNDTDEGFVEIPVTIVVAESISFVGKSQFPRRFLMVKNFPNPFNPATTILYTLPHSSHVVLTVFNARGQKVRELVNRRQPAGQFPVRFDGSGLASGIYYYRLSTENGAKIGKMVLLR